MVSFDATIVIQLINFLFFLFILNKIFFQPIIKIQKERQSGLNQALQQTEAKHAELKKLRADHQRQLDEARQNAFDMVSAQMEKATEECNAQISAVQAELDIKMNETREQLALQEIELRKTLNAQIAPLANQIVAKLNPAKTTQEAGA